HVFSNTDEQIIVASKGAPEAIMKQSRLTSSDKEEIANKALKYAEQGYRVLGVGKAIWDNHNFPGSQEEFVFECLGLIAFYDPPKEQIAQTIKTFNEAGIIVKMITGDHVATAKAIAKRIELNNYEECLTGEDVLQLSNHELRQQV